MQDTYFARGNDLRRSLKSLADAEGFKHYDSGPNIHIEIDGSDKSVELHITITKEASFNITSCTCFCTGEYIKDLVFIYSDRKSLPANTSYQDVEKWLHSFSKGVFTKIKEKNAAVLEKLKDDSKEERRSWLEDRKRLYKYL